MSRKASEAEVAQWQSHIRAWQRSGLSQAAYCQQHDVAWFRFGYWRKKLRDSQPVSGFVRVVRPQSTGGLSVRLPNGLTIHGVDANNLTVVTELLVRLS